MKQDVNIEVEPGDTEEEFAEKLIPVLDHHRKQVDTNEIRISVCKRCGRYPRMVFEDTRNCISGHCFRKHIKALVDGIEQLPD